MSDRLEFYDGDTPVAFVKSSIVPTVGSKISIKKVTWTVTRVSYALDHSGGADSERDMRANIDIERVKP
jgi:hypothetical protein